MKSLNLGFSVPPVSCFLPRFTGDWRDTDNDMGGRKKGGLSNTYGAIHQWVRATLGRASKCEFCYKVRTPESTFSAFQWSCKNGKPDRNPENWQQACPKCHSDYDRNVLGKKFNGGVKGTIPWNKGTLGVMIAWNKGIKRLKMKRCADCPTMFQPKRALQILCSQSCVNRRGAKAVNALKTACEKFPKP